MGFEKKEGCGKRRERTFYGGTLLTFSIGELSQLSILTPLETENLLLVVVHTIELQLPVSFTILAFEHKEQLLTLTCHSHDMNLHHVSPHISHCLTPIEHG